jgi:hypothetical protein
MFVLTVMMDFMAGESIATVSNSISIDLSFDLLKKIVLLGSRQFLACNSKKLLKWNEICWTLIYCIITIHKFNGGGVNWLDDHSSVNSLRKMKSDSQ